ncbi:MAG: hypothetical protein JWP97_3194 [Labilithrix sp.]|nr:hypothetical protein [Labilithrix sp.]
MSTQSTGVEEHDQWRERIMRALKDLRGDDSQTVGLLRENQGQKSRFSGEHIEQ